MSKATTLIRKALDKNLSSTEQAVLMDALEAVEALEQTLVDIRGGLTDMVIQGSENWRSDVNLFAHMADQAIAPEED